MTFHIPPEPEGRTQVHRAARTGNVEMLRELLADGADVGTPDIEGTTPLHLAARSGTAGTARLLLEAGADPNPRDRHGWTPLVHACIRKGVRPELIAVLREFGADPYQRDDSDQTPRDWAASMADQGLPDPLGDLPLPEPKPRERHTDAGQLSDAEMQLVVDGVRAVVDRDYRALREMGFYEDYDEAGDPFVWVDHYLYANPEEPDRLTMPPGEPRTWPMDVFRSDERDWVGVELPVFGEQEGESDLTLQLEISGQSDGSLRLKLGDIHVM